MAAVIAYGLGTALSVGSSLSSKKKAKKERKKAEALNRLMTAEEVRRLGKEQEAVLGTARSQIAASGFTGYGASTEAYMKELRSEQAKEIQFTKQVGAEKAGLLRSQGKAQESAYGYQAASSLLQGVTQIGENFNWGLD